MTDATQEAAQAEGPANPAPPSPPASPAKILTDALAAMNHPSNLSMTDRLHAIQNALNVVGTQLLPLLPTE